MSKILEIEKIGIHYNFFDLGGHSLLAIQVQSRIRNIYEVDISLRGLFESPTIAKLAKSIENSHSLAVTGNDREQGVL